MQLKHLRKQSEIKIVLKLLSKTLKLETFTSLIIYFSSKSDKYWIRFKPLKIRFFDTNFKLFGNFSKFNNFPRTQKCTETGSNDVLFNSIRQLFDLNNCPWNSSFCNNIFKNLAKFPPNPINRFLKHVFLSLNFLGIRYFAQIFLEKSWKNAELLFLVSEFTVFWRFWKKCVFWLVKFAVLCILTKIYYVILKPLRFFINFLDFGTFMELCWNPTFLLSVGFFSQFC